MEGQGMTSVEDAIGSVERPGGRRGLLAGRPLTGPFLRNAPFLCIVALHFAAALVVHLRTAQPLPVDLLSSLSALFGRFVPVFVLTVAVWHFLRLALVVRPARPLRRYAADAAGLVQPARLVDGAIIMIAVTVLTGSVGFFKAAIPEIDAFSWDPALARLDRLLHFGTDPWRILFAAIGTPRVVTALNAAYHVWLLVLYFMIFLAAFSGDGAYRRRFFLGYAVMWLVAGNLAAAGFASGGPVYFDRLGHGDTFLPLMDRLRAFSETSPVWALRVQDMLWESYVGDGEFLGISAMPSMHVATSTFLACAAWSRARWAGLLLSLFAATILVGSVMLGWHYAIDGYAGIAFALAAWWVAGRVPGAADGRRGTAA